MDLHLTDEQVALLVTELDCIIDTARFPLSPRVKALARDPGAAEAVPGTPAEGGADEAIRAAVSRPLQATSVKSVSWVLALLLAQATPPPMPHDKPFEVPLNPPKQPQSCQQLRTEDNKCENDLKSCDQRLVERLRLRCAQDAPHKQ